jgi:hypothetical protein
MISGQRQSPVLAAPLSLWMNIEKQNGHHVQASVVVGTRVALFHLSVEMDLFRRQQSPLFPLSPLSPPSLPPLSHTHLVVLSLTLSPCPSIAVVRADGPVSNTGPV